MTDPGQRARATGAPSRDASDGTEDPASGPAALAAATGSNGQLRARRIATAVGLGDGATPTAHAPTSGVHCHLLASGHVLGPSGWAWSHAPLPTTAAGDLDRARITEDAATIAQRPDGGIEVRTGISGAQGLYVHLDPDSGEVAIASLPTALVDADVAPSIADWDAWAEIIASGGGFGGRTPFRHVRRLQPTDALVIGAHGTPMIEPRAWEWFDEVPEGSATLDDIADALDHVVARIADRAPLHVLLSGGWDSRVLAALAARHDPGASAWTTSKDAGTAWEELIARRVARELHLSHRIQQPDAAAFADDMVDYSRTVGYQTSYHVWLNHLVRGLQRRAGTVLDGLGGGVFFGGAFPPTFGLGSAHERRFAQSIRYLRSAPGVLRPEVEEQLTERVRAGFDEVTRPLVGHREVDALSAYLIRTLPGISLGPFGLVARYARTATPFLAHRVVRASAAIPAKDRRDRRLYPALLRRIAPTVADLPTAQEPPPRDRRRPQRGASVRTATAMRASLTAHAVGELLHPDLRHAEVKVWQRHLESKADQHVLRSLWMLALWLDRYRPSGEGPEVLARPVG